MTSTKIPCVIHHPHSTLIVLTVSTFNSKSNQSQNQKPHTIMIAHHLSNMMRPQTAHHITTVHPRHPPRTHARKTPIYAAASVSTPTKPAPTTSTPAAPPTPSTPVLLDWKAISELAGTDVLKGFTLRPKGVPSTAPTPTLATKPPTGHKTRTAPVLLYRDTNAWCPFCERVWLALEHKGIPYDTVLIDLRDKPQWYKDMVPTTLVPAVEINGQVVYESRDILMKLEEEFPEAPLLPAKDTPAYQHALELMEGSDAVSKAGYTYMAGRRYPAPRTPEGEAPAPEPTLEQMRAALEAALGDMETRLGETEGPFFLGNDLSVVDIMYVPTLERLGANLPQARNMDIRTNPNYPRLAAWFAALDALPAYAKVRSDDVTLHLLLRRLFSMAERSPEDAPAAVQEARREAAAKLAANHQRIIQDILQNSGLMRSTGSDYGCTAPSLFGRPATPTRATVAAIDHVLRRLGSQLVTGAPGPRHPDRAAAAIGAATMAFFHNRASSPRDMSAAAAQELRSACMEVMRDLY